MTREDIAQLITALRAELETNYIAFVESAYMKELQEKFESMTPEEQKKVEKEVEEKCNQEVYSNVTKVPENIAREVLKNLSMSLIQEYSIQQDGMFSMDFFGMAIEYLIDSVDKDHSFFNELLANDEFMDIFSFKTAIVEKIINLSDNKEVLTQFLHSYTDKCKSGKEEKKYDLYNSSLSSFVGAILISDKYDDEFKEFLLKDPALLPFYDIGRLMNEISKSSLPREKKLEYLTNPEYVGEIDSYPYTTAIMELCSTKEDYEFVINNEQIAPFIDFGRLLSSATLPSEELKELFFDEKVQEYLTPYQISSFIEKANMDYETRKEILFDKRIEPLLNAVFLPNILASKNLTSSERLELLSDERIIKYVNDGYSFEGILPKILKSKDVPLEDKIAIIKDSRFNYRLDSEDMHEIFSDENISIETANDLLLDKKLFYKLIGEYHEEYNPDKYAKQGPFKYDKYEFLQKLMERNPYVAKTASYRLFTDDMIDLGIDFIDKLSRDPALCKTFSINYDEHQPVRRLYIKHAIESIMNSSYKDDIDISDYVTRIINASSDFRQTDFDTITNEHLERRIVDIRRNSHLKYDELTEENWKTLTEIGLRDISPYLKSIEYLGIEVIRHTSDIRLNILPSVDTKEDLDNYEERRRMLCDEVFRKTVESKDLEGAKNALFNKYFSINIEDAIEIVKLYGHSIDKFKENPTCSMQVKYIEQIKRILDMDKIHTVKEVYESPIKPLTFDDTIYLDQSIKKMFSKEISESVYKVHGEATEIEVNGRKVKVYEPGLDFKMLVHSTDAYGKLELINDNYDDSWNKSSRTTNHGICCSLIANNNLGIAEVKDVLFGFDGWDPRAIHKAAPYDIYSTNDSYDVQEGRKMMFMTAQNIINNTRHAHNEMVLERTELREDKKGKDKPNIQPSYVIIYSDMTDEIKEKAIKCSQDMNIPIVYLDKEKIANNEVAKIDAKIELLKETHDIDEKMVLLQEIILMHENNRSGYRMTNSEWLEEKFPTSKVDKVIKQLVVEMQIVYDATGDVVNYYKQSSKLMQILDEENQKFITTEENNKRKHTIDLPIDEYKMGLMQHINPNLGKTNIPLLEYIIEKKVEKGSEDLITRELTSLGKDFVHEQIEEVQSNGLYQSTGRSHNIGHIERTLVFATLVGREELKKEDGSLDEHAIDLLTKAAIYHDCARENDYEDKNHGLRSAERAEDLLRKDGYREEDIAMIKIAIEYHEVKDDDLRFEKICAKNGLDEHKVEYVEKIAKCLKDADALDRTRFHNDATLNPRMLRTKKAKELVTFATELNGEYRTINKEAFKDSCRKAIIDEMAKNATMGGREADGRQI